MRTLFERLGVTYVLLGLAATLAPGFEVFPFFCWFLFPIVPGNEPRYELMVDTLQDKVFSPRVNFQKLNNIKDPMAMDLWLATQRLGKAIEIQQPEIIHRTRRLIETNFLCTGSKYTIDRVIFDPIDRWKHNKVSERVSLATFNSQATCQTAVWNNR
ncbi:MAG: hypothetical protein KTR25_11325 [Myxococcales bacterium]|nr:hypothetical protein [Myxococcales bacterium]